MSSFRIRRRMGDSLCGRPAVTAATTNALPESHSTVTLGAAQIGPIDLLQRALERPWPLWGHVQAAGAPGVSFPTTRGLAVAHTGVQSHQLDFRGGLRQAISV
jgi:hypothetical protein